MILAIDTCLANCAAALWDGERVRVRQERIGTGHAERLAPMVAELLDEAGTDAGALARVVCTIGPGSFMGARVGISFAKGLALPRGLPTVPLTTTEAVAMTAPRPLTVLIDARRGQAYAERFGDGTTPLSLVPYAEAAALAAGGPILGVGLGAIFEGAGTAAADAPATAPDMFPDVGAMARRGAAMTPGRLRPLYLRAPDAKPGKAPV